MSSVILFGQQPASMESCVLVLAISPSVSES